MMRDAALKTASWATMALVLTFGVARAQARLPAYQPARQPRVPVRRRAGVPQRGGGRGVVEGAGTVNALAAAFPKLSLVAQGLIGKPTGPMLIVGGARDNQVPISDLDLLLLCRRRAEGRLDQPARRPPWARNEGLDGPGHFPPGDPAVGAAAAWGSGGTRLTHLLRCDRGGRRSARPPSRSARLPVQAGWPAPRPEDMTTLAGRLGLEVTP